MTNFSVDSINLISWKKKLMFDLGMECILTKRQKINSVLYTQNRLNCFMIWSYRMTHVRSLTPGESLKIKMSIQIVYLIPSAFEALFLRMESISWMTVVIKMEVEFTYPTYPQVCPLIRRQNVILRFADICNSVYIMLKLL